LSGGRRLAVIAIDGPAGAGKSTIDTGAMYRAVALWARRQEVSVTDMHRMEQLAAAASIELEPGGRALLNGEDVSAEIRTPEVSAAASQAAAIPGVRRAMVEKQRAMAASASVVMEGRDIGSVVFPNADVKIFLDADPAERTRRREAETAGAPSDLAAQLRERDERDRTRAESPLVQAPDAVYIDSTGLSIEQVEEEILKVIRAKLSNGKTFE
jgi:cytidylate kinase